jgi:hypothetical protein
VKGIVPVQLGLAAEIKFFGRHKGGSIRDGVILDLIESSAEMPVGGNAPSVWDCDSDAIIAAMDGNP